MNESATCARPRAWQFARNKQHQDRRCGCRSGSLRSCSSEWPAFDCSRTSARIREGMAVDSYCDSNSEVEVFVPGWLAFSSWRTDSVCWRLSASAVELSSGPAIAATPTKLLELWLKFKWLASKIIGKVGPRWNILRRKTHAMAFIPSMGCSARADRSVSVGVPAASQKTSPLNGQFRRSPVFSRCRKAYNPLTIQ